MDMSGFKQLLRKATPFISFETAIKDHSNKVQLFGCMLLRNRASKSLNNYDFIIV